MSTSVLNMLNSSQMFLVTQYIFLGKFLSWIEPVMFFCRFAIAMDMDHHSHDNACPRRMPMRLQSAIKSVISCQAFPTCFCCKNKFKRLSFARNPTLGCTQKITEECLYVQCTNCIHFSPGPASHCSPRIFLGFLHPHLCARVGESSLQWQWPE